MQGVAQPLITNFFKFDWPKMYIEYSLAYILPKFFNSNSVGPTAIQRWYS